MGQNPLRSPDLPVIAKTNENFYEIAWNVRLQFVESLIAEGETNPYRIIKKLESFERRYGLILEKGDYYAQGPDSGDGELLGEGFSGVARWVPSERDGRFDVLPTGVPSSWRSSQGGAPVDVPAYADYASIPAKWVVDLCGDDWDSIVELGSGMGRNLFEIYCNGGPAKTKYYVIIPLTRHISIPIFGVQEADVTTFYEFQKQFPDDKSCLRKIMTGRYGGTTLDCPKCGVHGKFYRLARDRAYLCQHCKHHIYPCVGTPMERSRTPLVSWFYAMYLFSTSRHGVAAKELQRQIGVTYKTAWRMAHEIRKYMARVDGEWPLRGDIEADETYVGGRTTGGKRGRGAPNKTVVFGMLERDGDVMAKVVPNVRKKTLQPIIEESVAAGSTVHTDELKSYSGLSKAGFEHETVNHGAGQYVVGDCHVNGIEGFWARLKLSIRGTHVHVSPKHLQNYVKEFEYRYNRRKRPDAIFGDLVANL